MPVKIKSFEAAFTGALREKLADNLTDAIIYYNETLKDHISTQGPPRSSPGQFPHRDSGDLIGSIKHEDATPDELVARSGSDQVYSIPLELGHNNVAARPYWVPTFFEGADEIAARVLKP